MVYQKNIYIIYTNIAYRLFSYSFILFCVLEFMESYQIMYEGTRSDLGESRCFKYVNPSFKGRKKKSIIEISHQFKHESLKCLLEFGELISSGD